MARRYYAVAEVEEVIPSLERIFTLVLQLRGALRVQEKLLESKGVRLSRELLEKGEARLRPRESSPPAPPEPPDVRQAKGLFRACYEALGEELARIGDLGGEVKDLDGGLVDFPGKRGDEDILLCWKLGEKRIGFWHTVEAGFAGRRPIDDQVPREPPRLD